MTTPQKDRLNMFLKVRTFLVNNATALGALALIATLQTKFQNIITAVINADGEASEDITGNTDLKEQKQTAVRNQGLKVCRAATLYFKFTAPNPVKLKKVNLLQSEIDGMRDTDLYTRIKKVFAITDPVKASIVAPDFAAADVTNLNVMNEEYFEVLEAPQDARSLRSSFNKEADRQLELGKQLLEEELDIAMATFIASNRQLHEYYQSARLIDDTGSRTALSGFDLKTYTIAGNSSMSLGAVPDEHTRLYIKDNGPHSINICVQPMPTSMCNGGTSAVLSANEEFLDEFVNLGVGLSDGFLILTNTGPQEITVRAGVKE